MGEILEARRELVSHDWHEGAGYEWKYMWGNSLVGDFYHSATFRKGIKSFSHFSVNGKFWEHSAWEINIPTDKPVIVHNTKTMIYYSVPGNPWFDHAWGEKIGADWDWVSAILNDGTVIMALEKSDDRLCDFTKDGKTFESEFILKDKLLHIYKLGAFLTLEPLKDEVIFKPTHGRPYSETPISVIFNGKEVGFGCRERTYPKEKQNGKI